MVLCRDYQFSERRACGLVGICRSSNKYRPKPDRHARLRERLLALSGKYRRYGYRMLHAKLRQEGFVVNVKVVERLYAECIVIDEGQDILNAPILNCLDLLIDGGFKYGRRAIFLDGEIQPDVYGRMDLASKQYLGLLGAAVFLLRENFRNPKTIIGEMCSITKLPEPICRRLLPSKVDYRVAKDEREEGKKLRALLVELIQEGVIARDITILSLKKRKESCLEKHEIDVGTRQR